MSWQFTENKIGVLFPPMNLSITPAVIAAQNPGQFIPPVLTRARAFDPALGEGEFILALGLAAMQVGDFVSINPFTGVPTRTIVATRGGIMGISMSANTDPTAYSWYQIFGTAVARCTTAASAGLPLYQSATAGTLLSTVAATGLVLGMASASATGFTLATTKLIGTISGSLVIAVPNTDGLFVGQSVSGTGVGASAKITAIGGGGPMYGAALPQVGFITVDVASTATGSVAGTFTGTGFALAAMAYPSSVGLG
jgi:hypothetical protein